MTDSQMRTSVSDEPTHNTLPLVKTRWKNFRYALEKDSGGHPKLVLPHPDLVSAALKMDLVHQLADQVNAAAVVLVQILTLFWIG